MISISLYHQYTRNIATALGIGYVLAVNDEQVTAQIPDSADPVLVAIIPSADTAGSADYDSMSETDQSLRFIIAPIKSDTDTAEFFIRIQILAEQAKKIMLMYAESYPTKLGIREANIATEPVHGEFSGNYAGYVISFSLTAPATMYNADVPALLPIT